MPTPSASPPEIQLAEFEVKMRRTVMELVQPYLQKSSAIEQRVKLLDERCERQRGEIQKLERGFEEHGHGMEMVRAGFCTDFRREL